MQNRSRDWLLWMLCYSVKSIWTFNVILHKISTKLIWSVNIIVHKIFVKSISSLIADFMLVEICFYFMPTISWIERSVDWVLAYFMLVELCFLFYAHDLVRRMICGWVIVWFVIYMCVCVCVCVCVIFSIHVTPNVCHRSREYFLYGVHKLIFIRVMNNASILGSCSNWK